MRPYEIMIILDPTLDDETVRAEVDRATELIKTKGGEPGRVERWGKRRLAYEIRKHREGNYVVVSAQSEPSVMTDLDRMLTLTDGVLRHKVVHLPEKALGKPARPLGTVGPDDGAPLTSPTTSASPTSEPGAPPPAPAAVTDSTVAAEAVPDSTVAAEAVPDSTVAAEAVPDNTVAAE